MDLAAKATRFTVLKAPFPSAIQHDLLPNGQWQAIFGSDPAALGRHVRKHYQIVIYEFVYQKGGRGQADQW
jgi:hypothetical protein